jgi:hypothetical protein
VGGSTGRTATRKDLVLWLADTDGGAHVDPTLDVHYDDLLRHGPNVEFFANGQGGDLGSVIAPSMRQVAYELLESLSGWLLQRTEP